MDPRRSTSNRTLRATLCEKNILDLNIENLFQGNRDVLALVLRNQRQPLTILSSLDLGNFPKIFLFIIETRDGYTKEICDLISQKNLPKNPHIYLQLFNTDKTTSIFYEKSEHSENFTKMEFFNSENNRVNIKSLKLLKSSESFADVRNLFEILIHLKCSLLNLTYKKISKFIVGNKNNKFLFLKNAIINNNKNVVKMMLLCTTKVPYCVLEEALKKEDSEILVTILEFLDHNKNDEIVIKILSNQRIFEILKIHN